MDSSAAQPSFACSPVDQIIIPRTPSVMQHQLTLLRTVVAPTFSRLIHQQSFHTTINNTRHHLTDLIECSAAAKQLLETLYGLFLRGREKRRYQVPGARLQFDWRQMIGRARHKRINQVWIVAHLAK